MKSRSFVANVVIVALLLLALGVHGIWAQETERGVTDPKTAPEGALAQAGIETQDLSGELTPEDLVHTLTCGGLTVSNITYTGADVAAGIFQSTPGIIGLDEGIILSTGNIANVVGPNMSDRISADNGAACLAALGKDAFDVIVLDVMMPGMDGLQVCERLREHKTWRTIPVVLLTAKDDIETRSRGMLLGVSEYLTKPVNKLELFARVQAQLHSRELERKLDATAATVANLAAK